MGVVVIANPLRARPASLLSDGACRRSRGPKGISGKPTDLTRHTHHRLHAARTKKPRRSGVILWLGRACPGRDFTGG